MSATDPLRDLANELRALGEAYRDEYPDGRVAKRDLHDIAERLEVLAAVPAEPEHNDKRAAFLAGEGTLTVAQVQEWAVELSDSTFADLTDDDTPLMVSVVRPAEPKVWEWRAGGGTSGHAPVGPEESQDRARQTYEWFARCPATWTERRRPGTAPSEWERVDPEPREKDSP